MSSLFAIFIGGGLGSLCRFCLSLVLNGRLLPWGTFTVNLLGSFVLGLGAAWAARHGWSDFWQRLLIVGFCGGFTTFSTFSKEWFDMLSQGRGLAAVLYPLGTLAGVLACVAIGYRLGMGR